jgi:hypothetical protein
VVTILMDDVITDDVRALIEAPTQRDDSGAERRRAEELVSALDGDRERLFELQSLFILRLHRASNDFGASEGLRVVESAIAIVTQEPVVAAQ